MKTLAFDWVSVTDREQFYNAILSQMEAPGWHGHNLDALNDSWVTGGICATGPPFRFRFRNLPAEGDKLFKFASIVLEIAYDSVEENGGVVLLDGE